MGFAVVLTPGSKSGRCFFIEATKLNKSLNKSKTNAKASKKLKRRKAKNK